MLEDTEPIEQETTPEEGTEGKLTTMELVKVARVSLSTGRETTALDPELPKTEIERDPSI